MQGRRGGNLGKVEGKSVKESITVKGYLLFHKLRGDWGSGGKGCTAGGRGQRRGEGRRKFFKHHQRKEEGKKSQDRTFAFGNTFSIVMGERGVRGEKNNGRTRRGSNEADEEDGDKLVLQGE